MLSTKCVRIHTWVIDRMLDWTQVPPVEWCSRRGCRSWKQGGEEFRSVSEDVRVWLDSGMQVSVNPFFFTTGKITLKKGRLACLRQDTASENRGTHQIWPETCRPKSPWNTLAREDHWRDYYFSKQTCGPTPKHQKHFHVANPDVPSNTPQHTVQLHSESSTAVAMWATGDAGDALNCEQAL